MIINNSLLTKNSKLYELTNYYYSTESIVANNNINSLYSYLSYKIPWNTTILESTVANTNILKIGGILANSNTIFIMNENNIFDLFVGMSVENENGYLPANTRITSIDYDIMAVNLNNISANSYMGNTNFIGLNQLNKLTIDDNNVTAELSNEIDYYKDCKLYIDVNGDLSYTRTVTKYDPVTRTLTFTPDLNDAPPLTTESIIRLYYNNEFPPKPKNTDKELRDIYDSMFHLKRISTSNMCPVIERINWITGTIYDYYHETDDLGLKDSTGKLIKKYYIMNQYFQVFKCLWNNNGLPSTDEPYFAPGIYDTTLNIFKGYNDKYKWKYMFTVPRDYVQKFMDDNWIPILLNSQADLNTNVITNDTRGGGGIEVINITNGGNGYTYNYPPTITITGDGSGANGTAEITNGEISDIIISNAGKNYTYANVAITSANAIYGYGATCQAMISSIGGHGKDLISELSCDKLMVISYYDSLDNIPIDMEIRQHGLISGIVTTDSYPDFDNSNEILAATSIITSPGIGSYQRGEIVYQSESTFENSTFTARCIDFAEANNRLLLTNVKGNYILGNEIIGVESDARRKILIYTPTKMIPYSGRILTIENISEVIRSTDSIQIFKVILKF